MKKMIFLMLTLLIWSAVSMNAQVTIGSSELPAASAVLDLNTGGTGKLGLLLPLVDLENETDNYTIPAPATGLVVYATGDKDVSGDKAGLAAGVYAWDGLKWLAGGIGSSIIAPSVAVTGVTLDITSETLITVDQTLQLTETVAPEDATNRSVTWESSDTDIATVSASGLVTAVADGTATITVTTVDGSKTATCAITVSIANEGGSLPPVTNGLPVPLYVKVVHYNAAPDQPTVFTVKIIEPGDELPSYSYTSPVINVHPGTQNYLLEDFSVPALRGTHKLDISGVAYEPMPGVGVDTKTKRTNVKIANDDETISSLPAVLIFNNTYKP
jgi:hypothetical protein